MRTYRYLILRNIPILNNKFKYKYTCKFRETSCVEYTLYKRIFENMNEERLFIVEIYHEKTKR